jgi:O-antigen/teichoic acid export membrane protein
MPPAPAPELKSSHENPEQTCESECRSSEERPILRHGAGDLNPSASIVNEFKKLLQQSSHYLLGLIGGLGLGFISFPIFTRAFSVADYGLIEFALKILMLVTAFGKAGIQNAAMRFFNRQDFEKDPLAEPRFYSTIFWGVGGIALALTLLFTFSVGALPQRIVDRPLAALLSFASVLIVLRALQSILWAFLRIEERTKAYNVFQLVMKATTIACIYALVLWKGPTARNYYTGTIIAEIAVVIWVCLPMFRRGLLSFSSYDGALFRAAFLFGAPLVVQELAFLVLDSGDRALVRIYLGADALGFYTVAYGLASYVNTLLQAPITLAIVPIYVRMWNSQGARKTGEFLSFSMDLFIMGAACLFAIAAVASKDAVIILASPKYRGTEALIPILVAGLLVYTLQIFLTAGLLIQKKTGTMALAMTVSAIFNIILNCIFLPIVGLPAAAWTTLVSYVVFTVLLAYLSFKYLPLDIYWRSIARYVIAAAAAWTAGTWTNFGAPILNLFGKSAAALLVYIIVLLMLDRRLRDGVTDLLKKYKNREGGLSIAT